MRAPLIDYAALGKDALLCVPTHEQYLPAAGALLVQRAFQCRELMSSSGVNSCPFLNTKLA
jgi:hypothetical protein